LKNGKRFKNCKKKMEMKAESYKVTGCLFEDVTTKNGTF